MGQNRPSQTTRPAASPPGGGSLPRRSLRGMAADLPHWAVGKPPPRGGTAPALKSAAARPGKRRAALPTGREPPNRVRRAPNAGEQPLTSRATTAFAAILPQAPGEQWDGQKAGGKRIVCASARPSPAHSPLGGYYTIFCPRAHGKSPGSGFSQRGFCDMIGAQPQRAKLCPPSGRGEVVF